MIDPKELRIGNILQSRDKDGDGSVIIVKEFSLGGINPFVSQAGYEYEYSYEKTDYYSWYWVEPIELSPEWMDKCGFVTPDGYQASVLYNEIMIDLHLGEYKL